MPGRHHCNSLVSSKKEKVKEKQGYTGFVGFLPSFFRKEIVSLCNDNQENKKENFCDQG